MRPPGSREFTDQVLLELKRDGYRPAAWLRMMVGSGRRSIEQVAAHPVAAAETLAISAALGRAGGARLRPAAAGMLAVAHLGLLGERRSLGLANALSLIRAGLPARAWAAPFAVATDAIDGLVARRNRPTAFGAFADPLADVAFWTAVAAGSGGVGRLSRSAIVALWTGPAAAITVAYFGKGQTVDYPRWLFHRRLSAVAQLVLTVALLRRSSSWTRRRDR